MQGIKIQLLRRRTDLSDELEPATESEPSPESKTDRQTGCAAEPKQTGEGSRTAKASRVDTLAATEQKEEDRPNDERAAEIDPPLTEGKGRQEKPGRKSD